LIRKIQRQEKYVVRNPPSGGPSRGPICVGTERNAAARTYSDRGAVRRSTRRPTGVTAAPPIPCSARASASSNRLELRPQNTDPRVNTTMAIWNTVRAPKRSASQPVTGMKTATLTI
jgi:hypothetical protein